MGTFLFGKRLLLQLSELYITKLSIFPL